MHVDIYGVSHCRTLSARAFLRISDLFACLTVELCFLIMCVALSCKMFYCFIKTGLADMKQFVLFVKLHLLYIRGMFAPSTQGCGNK